MSVPILNAYNKTVSVINSCITEDQLHSAMAMVKLFCRCYHNRNRHVSSFTEALTDIAYDRRVYIEEAININSAERFEI